MSEAEQLLKRRVEEQSLSCIGCNDCLLACPIQESKFVTIAELNAAIRAPVLTGKNVFDFVTACTQCKQCVPACPADLNRAEMVLVNKLKAEDSVADFELMLQARTVTFPSGMSLDGLAQSLTALELFAEAGVSGLRRLILKSTLRLLVPGEELCHEGEFHERLCVVLEGSLEQTSRGARGERLSLLMLGPGSFFGEMGVLADAREPFSVSAREKSLVLEAPKVAVLRLMELSSGFGRALQSLYARRAIYSYARQPTALGALPEPALDELLAQAELNSLPAGSLVFSAGDVPRDCFIVRSGFLRAKQADVNGERVLTYFAEGQMFGILGLLHRDPAQSYTVEAASRAEVIRIPGAALGAVLARHPGLYPTLLRGFEAEQLARARHVGLGPIRGSVRPTHAPGSQARAEHGTRASLEAGFLVEAGIAAGREVLVIDQTRCTGCGNCVEACARRHGQSRLQLRGIQVDDYMFPNACRHCADPACLLCSVNGIVRLPSGEIKIVEDNCIGCGSCAERCPYGNISMHPVHEPGGGLWLSLLDFLRGPREREQALAALDPKQERVAVKCDLCSGHADYACVTACPVAAAFRIDPERALATASPGA